MKYSLLLLFVALLLPPVHAETVSVPYRARRDAQVSLAVYDQQGRLVRTLLTGAPRKPGQYVEAWDGCDRYGKPQPPGKYTWKFLETKGLTAEFLLEVGQNPFPKAERGIGNHGAPGSVVADETGVYLAALSEGAHVLAKTDREGKYLYVRDQVGMNWGAHRGFAITLLDGKLYDLCGDGLAYGFYAATGQCFTDDDDGRNPWNLNWPGTTNKVTGAMDLAGDPTNKLLVVSYREQNGLRWFDPAQKGKSVDELTGLDHPTGIAVKADGTVLVIAKGAVWAVSPGSNVVGRARPPGAPYQAGLWQISPQPVIPAEKLQSPWRLDVNRNTGEILVAENSEAAGGALPLTAGGVANPSSQPRHHQVKKFSATGELLATYGKPEGRRDGPYIATDFRNINDVAFDPLGGFFVSEGPWTPPRRSVRLDDAGQVLHEWFGGQAWGTLAVPEPGDPAHVWLYVNAPPASGLVRCEIDFAKRSWRVVETYWDVFLDNALGNIAPNYLEITPRAGKLYIYTGTPFSLSIVVYDPKKKTLRPSNHSQRQLGLPRDLVPADFRGDWDSYIWNDQNDDGQATPNELIWMHRPVVGGYTDPADFTLYLVGQACAFTDGFKITPRRFTAGGTPVYDWADAKPTPTKWKEGDFNEPVGDLHHNPDGTWFGCFATFQFSSLPDWEAHGRWYYNTCSGMDRLVKWDKDWKPIWSVGRHSPDAEHEIGSTAMARFLGGTTHGCVIWADASDEETAGPTVWTDDGLYVDELWRIHGDTSGENVYGIGTVNEFASGRLLTDTKTGRVYFYMISAALGSTVYEIHGWNGWRRDRGTVVLKRELSAPLSFTGTGLKAEYFNNLDLTGAPALTRADGPIWFKWCTNAPATEVHAGNFSVRWSGQVQPPTTEPYKFTLETVQYWQCDGPPKFIRMWVDGQPVDDDWIRLTAGQRYDIRIEAAWDKPNAVAKLCWETKANDRRAILPKHLYPASVGAPATHGEIVKNTWPTGLVAHIPLDDRRGIHPVCRGEIPGIIVNLVGDCQWTKGALTLKPHGPLQPAYIMVGNELQLPATDYTIAFRFKTTAPTGVLLQAKRRSPYNAAWSDHIVMLEGGKLRFVIFGQDAIVAPTSLNDGQWHQVVTAVGGTTKDCRLYVDGKLIGTGKLAVRQQSSNRLGVNLGGPIYGYPEGLAATFADFRCYGLALTGNEIQALWSK